MDALIGYSGFVGQTLLRQRGFEALYRSINIAEIRGGEFGVVVCAGASAKKWLANKEPDSDRAAIEGLMQNLAGVKAETFVLISTVDVFKDPVGVNEETVVEEEGLHAYGLHRRMLEKFVEANFANHLIVRLPGLVGPGLRKNLIYDFLNDNNVAAIDSRGKFQYYPMVNLWADIETALAAGLKLVHLTAEPLATKEIALQAFGRGFENVLPNEPARYDFRTKHAAVFGGAGSYQYSARESMLAVRAYAQSEPVVGGTA